MFFSMLHLLITVCCMLLAVIACIGLGEGAYSLQVHYQPSRFCSLKKEKLRHCIVQAELSNTMTC